MRALLAWVSFILRKLIAKGRENLFPGTIILHINGAYKVSANLASPPTYSLWSRRVRGHAGDLFKGGWTRYKYNGHPPQAL